MRVIDIILLSCIAILAIGVIILAIRGKFTIEVKRSIITKKELDPIQLQIAQANLEELKRYNDNAEKAAEEHTDAMRTITESVQTALGVLDETK